MTHLQQLLADVLAAQAEAAAEDCGADAWSAVTAGAITAAECWQAMNADIGGGFVAQIDARRGEEPNMRQLTLLLYPADGEEPEEEIVQTDIRPGEGAWKI